MQPIDYGSEPVDQFSVTIPEHIKRLGLLLEYGQNRFRGAAVIDHGGEGMIAQVSAGLFGVLSQGSIEEDLEGGESGGRITG
jgi:hypothetical protein